MSSRDQILASVRANLPRLDRPLPQVPMFDASAPESLLALFKESLYDMGGDFVDLPSGEDVRYSANLKSTVAIFVYGIRQL